METFTALKPMVADQGYAERRRRCLALLDPAELDPPVAALVAGCNALGFCFTLQSCFGHFLHDNRTHPRDTRPLPKRDPGAEVRYRIAYLALCVQAGAPGRGLIASLGAVRREDPDYIQIGCAQWFWDRHPNSYVLQVAPRRHMRADAMVIPCREARRVERVRNRFFERVAGITSRLGDGRRPRV